MDAGMGMAIEMYLQQLGFQETLQTMRKEMSRYGHSPGMSSRMSQQNPSSIFVTQMCIEQGNGPLFFQLWDSQGFTDFEAKKLEFYLHVYFAIYPIHQCNVMGQPNE